MGRIYNRYKRYLTGGGLPIGQIAGAADTFSPLLYKDYKSDYLDGSDEMRRTKSTNDAYNNISGKVENVLLSTGNPLAMGIGAGIKGSRLIDSGINKAATDQYGVYKSDASKIAGMAGKSINQVGNIVSGINNLSNKDLSTGEKILGFTALGSVMNSDRIARGEREKYFKNQAEDIERQGQEAYKAALASGFNPEGNAYVNNYKYGGSLYKRLGLGGKLGGGDEKTAKEKAEESRKARAEKFKNIPANLDEKLNQEAIDSSKNEHGLPDGTQKSKYTSKRTGPPKFRSLELGGNLNQLSQDNIEVQGPSHEQGGVKLPQLGVELEGGETINDDFVFSEELGFAERHKPIAKAIGKLEDKPQNRFTKNSLSRLKDREDLLKVEQEETKAALGLNNDMDMKKYGGKLYKKMRDGGFPFEYNQPTVPNFGQPKTGTTGTASYYGLDLPSNNNGIGYGQIPIDASVVKKTTPFASTTTAVVNPTSTFGGQSLGSLSGITDYADNITNFVLNAQRAKEKIPEQATTTYLNPVKYDFSASKVDADNQRLAFNRAIDMNTTNSGVANSNKAAGLYQTIMAKNQINQAESNANNQERARVSSINKEIESNNNAITLSNKMRKLQARDDIRRETSTNVSNAVSKLGTAKNDAKFEQLVKDQNMLNLSAQDPKTVSMFMKSNRDIFKRNGWSDKQIDDYINNASKKKYGGSLHSKLYK